MAAETGEVVGDSAVFIVGIAVGERVGRTTVDSVGRLVDVGDSVGARAGISEDSGVGHSLCSSVHFWLYFLPFFDFFVDE